MSYELYALGEIFASLILCKSCEEFDKETNERFEKREREKLEKKILKNLLESNKKSKHPKRIKNNKLFCF
tara:strand:- start:30 stop:239 length:210 start_codon:yes stop_codon:yes gene_type:complete